MFFYANGDKEEPLYFDAGKMKPSNLVEFIKEKTSYELNLPFDAHIPEDMLDGYYEDMAEGHETIEDNYLYKIELDE